MTQTAAHSDAVASIAGKMTIAGGTGSAVYAFNINENMLAIISVVFTIASFLLDLYAKKRAKEQRQHEIELQAEIQREKNARDYELQQLRLQIQQEQFAQIEARKERQFTQAMQSGYHPLPDSALPPTMSGGL